MPVTLVLASGELREIDGADDAYMDGPSFMVTRWDTRLERTQTVLTLLSDDVILVEIRKIDGRVATAYVFGAGVTQNV